MPISQRRFYVAGQRVFIRDDDLMTMIMKFEKKAHLNLNRLLNEGGGSKEVLGEI